MNPLLHPPKLPYGSIAFDQIKTDHFIPAIDESLAEARLKLDQYKENKSISFDDVILGLEEVSQRVDLISSIFFNLHSAECPDELQKIAPLISEKLTSFSSDISLDEKVFAKIKACYESKGGRSLTIEEKTYLDESFRGFVRNGANLDETQKKRLRQIDEELAKTSLEYSQNVLKASNQFQYLIENKDRLKGCPDSFIEATAELAEKKGHHGKWLITLDYPIFVPAMTYAEDKKLREDLWFANGKKAFGGEFDNQEKIKTLLKLRSERAKLLGYKTHADFVLEERMAQSPTKVIHFLNELLEKAYPAAKKEMAKLQVLALETDKITNFDRWDVAFYSEKLKKKELDFDGEKLRPYFKLENVVSGVFNVAKKLYNLEFKENPSIPTYHPDVKAYEVSDSNKGFIGLFYADFFPRETKRSGAWMTSYKPQGLINGKIERPHVSIVCNFTKPTKTKPSLLTLEEVLTLYHEFGHALHGLLSDCRYTKMSGTNVFWDFVELPSQIFENWVNEKECLDLFAVHYETGEKMPVDLIEKIKKSSAFLEGLGTMRQLTFALLDMSYHQADPNDIKDVDIFEKEINKKTDLLPAVTGVNSSCAFSHIFAGGYSAGYYSYKWAEVLDADAFEYFKEKGIFNPEVAHKFRTHILERGGSEHPMELYKKFRGKEPSIDPLLKRAGLI